MNLTTIADLKPAADPVDLHRQLEEIEARLETALSDEHATESELRDLEVSADRDAADAYLNGKVVKADAQVAGLRTRLKAVRSAKIILMARRDLLEADHQSANIDSLIASANRLNAERKKDYEIALALQAVSARLFARSIGDLGGSYPLHGRIGRCGIVALSDGIKGPYLSELSRISNELRAIGYSEAEAICKTRSSEIAGGEQLRGSPVVSRVRELANRIETGLIAGELLPSSYEKTNPDVPQNID